MKLRFLLDKNANKYKCGQWVKGLNEEKLFTGIYVSSVDKDMDIIATWKKKGKIRKKLYVEVKNIEELIKPENAPKDLIKFAKKHSMWIQGENK